ncbi:hypothetical protein [Frankia sp. Cas4]|nr:hypothetical protein [Frankia sp. Cas4]
MARVIRVGSLIVPALARLGPDAEPEQVRSVGAIRLLDSDQPSVATTV